MEIKKTIYNPRLLPPDGYTVECAGRKANFSKGEEVKAAEWIMDIWKEQEDPFFPHFAPAYLFYNIDWDADHELYAKYERLS